MRSEIDYHKLYNEGRCKEIGISWSEKEAVARSVGIPAEFVREGCLTMEAYEKRKAEVEGLVAKGKKPLLHMKKAELYAQAQEMGLQVTEEVPRATLISMISQQHNLSGSTLPASDEGSTES